MERDLRVINYDNPFSPQVTFSYGAYHSQRNPKTTVMGSKISWIIKTLSHESERKKRKKPKGRRKKERRKEEGIELEGRERQNIRQLKI